MFADITGFSALADQVGPERAYFAVTGALRLADGVARRHGGSVDKYLGDCLLIVFGHPVPLPDPARAATAAALEIRDQVREYARSLATAAPLDVVIGINTGTMVAGNVGAGIAREFHVLGDAVNVAARLKAKAPASAIYVGPETHAETRDGCEYRALGSLPLKGKRAAVEIFELLGSRERRAGHGSGARRDHPLVGRETELGRVMARLESLARGDGAVVVLAGEEGIGKSRLIAEAEAIAGDAFTFAHARAAAGTAMRSGEMLEDVWRACAVANAAVAESIVPAAVGDARAAAAGPTGAGAVLALTRARRHGRPVVIVLEDVDAADATSQDALPATIAALADGGVLVVVTVRAAGDPIVARVQAAVEPARRETLPLAPFDDGESRAFLAAVAREPLADDSLALSSPTATVIRLVSSAACSSSPRSAPSATARPTRPRRRHRAPARDHPLRRHHRLHALTERGAAPSARFRSSVGCLQRARRDRTQARRHGREVPRRLRDRALRRPGRDRGRAARRRQRRDRDAAPRPRRTARARPRARRSTCTSGSTPVSASRATSRTAASASSRHGRPRERRRRAEGPRARRAGSTSARRCWRATRDVFEYRELPPAPRKRGGDRCRVFELLRISERLHRARVGAERARVLAARRPRRASSTRSRPRVGGSRGGRAGS